MKKIFEKINRKNIARPAKSSRNRGFTLVETIVTIFIFGILMLGTTLLIRNIFVTGGQETGVLNNLNQANLIANSFVNELRNVAYGANGAYPISQATNNQIIFFSTAPKGNGTISEVRYFVSGNTLSKGLTNPAGNPPSYVGQTETITTLSTSLAEGGNPLFYYYDGNYNGSGNSLSNPVNINSVKFIKINLIVLKNVAQNGNSTFTVTAGASMRNLKTNLGN